MPPKLNVSALASRRPPTLVQNPVLASPEGVSPPSPGDLSVSFVSPQYPSQGQYHGQYQSPGQYQSTVLETLLTNPKEERIEEVREDIRTLEQEKQNVGITLELADEESEVDRQYCFCNKPLSYDSFMIQCDLCDEWYHGKCVKITQAEGAAMGDWTCFRCRGMPFPLPIHKDPKLMWKDIMKDSKPFDSKKKRPTVEVDFEDEDEPISSVLARRSSSEKLKKHVATTLLTPRKLSAKYVDARTKAGLSRPPATAENVKQIRLKIVKVLAEVLSRTLAEQIESELFKLFRSTNEDYRARFRDMIQNLKDFKNPKFRERVECGELKPAALVVLTADEMASQEVADWKNKVSTDALKNSILSEEFGAQLRPMAKGNLLAETDRYVNEADISLSDQAVVESETKKSGPSTTKNVDLTQFYTTPLENKNSASGTLHREQDRLSVLPSLPYFDDSIYIVSDEKTPPYNELKFEEHDAPSTSKMTELIEVISVCGCLKKCIMQQLPQKRKANEFAVIDSAPNPPAFLQGPMDGKGKCIWQGSLTPSQTGISITQLEKKKFFVSCIQQAGSFVNRLVLAPNIMNSGRLRYEQIPPYLHRVMAPASNKKAVVVHFTPTCPESHDDEARAANLANYMSFVDLFRRMQLSIFIE